MAQQPRKNDVLRYQFKKKKIFLITRKMTIPNGMMIEKDIILHPGAALIVPFLSPDKVVILRQYRSTINKYLYEFPAGTLEPGEQPAACARREIMEEAGYRAGKLKKVGMIYPVPGYSDEIIYIYKAERLSVQKETGDADEVLEPVVMTRAQIKKIFKAGKIVDGKTIAGLAFCGLLE
ncbi:MAG: NUDIX hydrolase [Candidatus Omnitrophica bacterium]|nr:NUDIX hydrolase [Candidatus Omnitrophota bacterium]